MRTTDALPPKHERSTCRTCGLASAAPIVVAGKCANAGACGRRVKIAARHAARTAPSTPSTPSTPSKPTKKAKP